MTPSPPDQLQRTRHVVKGNALGDEGVAVEQACRQHLHSPVQGVLQRLRATDREFTGEDVVWRYRGERVRSGDPEYMESACTPNGGQAGLEPADRARCLDDDVPALRLVEFGDVRADSASPETQCASHPVLDSLNHVDRCPRSGEQLADHQAGRSGSDHEYRITRAHRAGPSRATHRTAARPASPSDAVPREARARRRRRGCGRSRRSRREG